MKQIRILTVALTTASLSICSSVLAQTDTLSLPLPASLPMLPASVTARDSVLAPKYWLVHKRMKQLQKTIPLVHNAHSQRYVEFFMYTKPDFTKAMLEKQHRYFPIFEKYLAEYGLPDELKYLSLIESRLEPKIISSAGAGGLWQFMPVTGHQDFGLRIDRYIDERFDPYKSTEAACKYLKQLHRIFGDWEMALASYNTGPGNVRRAIQRSGRRGYWGVFPYLHPQTQGYVPQFAAMVYMMHYAHNHGIRTNVKTEPFAYDTIRTNGYTNLRTLAKIGQIPYEKIRELNPHILTDVVPANAKGYTVRLPRGELDYFYANRNFVMASATGKLDRYAVRETQRVQQALDVLSADEKALQAPAPNWLTHLVRKGETLIGLARRYGVSAAELSSWNGLKATASLLTGQKLLILVQKKVNLDLRAIPLISSGKTPKAQPQYYTVQPGDTLWSISQRLPKISLAELQHLNNLETDQVKSCLLYTSPSPRD